VYAPSRSFPSRARFTGCWANVRFADRLRQSENRKSVRAYTTRRSYNSLNRRCVFATPAVRSTVHSPDDVIYLVWQLLSRRSHFLTTTTLLRIRRRPIRRGNVRKNNCRGLLFKTTTTAQLYK